MLKSVVAGIFLLVGSLSSTMAGTGLDESLGRAPVELTQAQDSQAYRVVITSDYGGYLTEYIKKYNLWRQTGVRVRIDDLCISACTLITGLVPRSHVCTSSRGILAFHSASVSNGFISEFSEAGTRLLWALYPKDVRETLKSMGWSGPVPHPDLIYVSADRFYSRCEAQ
jgi:hypothetical protein